MNTQATRTKPIDWKHVGGVTLRAAWWLLKIAFKGLVLLGSVLFMLIAAIFARPDDEEEEKERLAHQVYGDKNYADYNRWK